jgi:hypothetical protein
MWCSYLLFMASCIDPNRHLSFGLKSVPSCTEWREKIEVTAFYGLCLREEPQVIIGWETRWVSVWCKNILLDCNCTEHWDYLEVIVCRKNTIFCFHVCIHNIVLWTDTNTIRRTKCVDSTLYVWDVLTHFFYSKSNKMQQLLKFILF